MSNNTREYDVPSNCWACVIAPEKSIRDPHCASEDELDKDGCFEAATARILVPITVG
jgi:hypothetical protein